MATRTFSPSSWISPGARTHRGHDAAYTELFFDGHRPPSFLEVPGAKEIGIEFHSLSKTYNMTGWRIGMAVGNREMLAALGKIKTNFDSGVFDAIQRAGIAALPTRAASGKTRRLAAAAGPFRRRSATRWAITRPKPTATFYVWLPVPKGLTSMGFTTHLLEQAGIVTIPGNGLGEPGEGYVRLALTVPKERLQEALTRVEKIG